MIKKAQTGDKQNKPDLFSRKQFCEGERVKSRGEVRGQINTDTNNREVSRKIKKKKTTGKCEERGESTEI